MSRIAVLLLCFLFSALAWSWDATAGELTLLDPTPTASPEPTPSPTASPSPSPALEPCDANGNPPDPSRPCVMVVSPFQAISTSVRRHESQIQALIQVVNKQAQQIKALEEANVAAAAAAAKKK